MGSQRSILGPALFNVFIIGLEDGIKWILMKFVSDTKWSEEGRPSCRNTWISWKNGLTRTQLSSTRTSIRSCTYENIIQEWSTGWDLPSWGASLWKGTWEAWWITNSVWVSRKVLRQKRNPVGFWVASSRTSPAVINSHYSTWPVLVRPRLEYCGQFWSPLCKEAVDRLLKGPQKWSEDWVFSTCFY